MPLTVKDLVIRSGVRNIDKECSDDDILAFAEHCYPWQSVGSHLGLTKSQLSAIDEDNHTASLKRVGVLQKWKETFVFKATYRVLIEALLKCGKANEAFKVCEVLAQRQGGGTSIPSRSEQTLVQQESSAIEDEVENESETIKADVRQRKPAKDSKERGTMKEFLNQESDPNGGHDLLKPVAVAILVLLAIGVFAYVFVISPSYNRGAHRSDHESEVPELSRKRADSSMDAQTKDDEIKKLNDLIQAVQEVGDWIGLCRNLGVSEGKLDTLIQNPNQPANQQKAECLRAYFNMGKAKWSKVVEAVKKYPISNSRLARKIAEDHGLPFDDKDEL